MARIVYAAGVSHTPMMTLDPSEWEYRAQVDLDNPHLNPSDGRFLTYKELEAEVGTGYADVAQFSVYLEKHLASQAALDRVAVDLAAAAPDVVLIVGDDQRELFSDCNQPAIAIHHGPTVKMNSSLFGREDAPSYIKSMACGYAMDKPHRFPAAPDLAVELIEGLVERGFDVGAVAGVPETSAAGFGHAYGFVVKRLFGGREIPILPILLNTYYGPNVPTAERCFQLGRALRGLIDASPSDLRVAVVASGGLSHFVVDEVLDRRVLAGLTGGRGDLLRTIPRGALNSGSSEILNWVAVGGMVEDHSPDWIEYFPVYRTPAGTGVGVAFASWNLPR